MPINQDVTDLYSEIESLVRAGDRQRLRLLLNEEYAPDLAELLERMPEIDRASCFRLLDLDNASAVLAEFDAETQRKLLGDLGELGVVSIIAHMRPDDAADLLSELPEDKARSIIAQIPDQEAVDDIQELMSYAEDSAGGIMSTDYLALNAKMIAGEALNFLREKYEKLEEDIYDIYVVNDDERLVGRFAVKDLLTADPEVPIASLMDDDVVTCDVDADQEAAVELLGRYDLLSLPIVDADGKLRGIITADDAIDVIQEEATEDIYQSSGISVPEEESSETLIYNVPLAFRARLPWLVVTLVIETLSAVVITHFDQVIKQAVVAFSFMPLLSAVTGGAATQSTCIMIRGGTMGQIDWSQAGINLLHELKVGVLLGIACGLITTVLCMVMGSGNFHLGLVVGISLFLTITVGVLTGTLIPMIFHKFGIEPAHASGPLITSLLDVYTFTIYLGIVRSSLEFIS